MALPSSSETGRFFVPRKPIRPHLHWPSLAREKSLTFKAEFSTGVAIRSSHIQVETTDRNYQAERVWCCAGALGTPKLLSSQFGTDIARDVVDDHVIIYLGMAQHTETTRPHITAGARGYWFRPLHSGPRSGLITSRPAVADFASLDVGFERRAIFGLPAKSILGRLLQRPSPGLLREAVFNKFGILPYSHHYSVYAQVLVRNAYEYDASSGRLGVNIDTILQSISEARVEARVHLPNLIPSANSDLYIPGVHLHHSVELQRIRELGLDNMNSKLMIADASTMANIGPEHHSFRMMAQAMLKARTAY